MTHFGKIEIEVLPRKKDMLEEHPEMLNSYVLPEAAVGTWLTPFSPPVNQQDESLDQDSMLYQEASENHDGKKTIWLDAHVKLLLAEVEDLSPHIGKSLKLKSKKKMWRVIEERFHKRGYTDFTAFQIENKFRSLERQYKKAKYHNKQTSRDRVKCPYDSEMTAVLGEQPSIFPEIIVGPNGSAEYTLPDSLEPRTPFSQPVYQDESLDQDSKFYQEASANSDEKKTIWLDAHVKLLLNEVKDLSPHIGKSYKLKSKMKMWRVIEERFHKKGYKDFTAIQIENKFRALERQYKKAKYHNKQTGTDRIKCPYESEMTAILGEQPSVFPELGASGSGEYTSPNSQEQRSSPVEYKPDPLSPTSSDDDTPILYSPVRTDKTHSKKGDTEMMDELRAIRKAKENYYEQKQINFEKKMAMREEHHRQKISLLKDLLTELKR